MEFHQKDLSELDELTEEHLGFSALSEGLGFSKSKANPKNSTEINNNFSSGAGAYKAGPVQFSAQIASPTPNSAPNPAALNYSNSTLPNASLSNAAVPGAPKSASLNSKQLFQAAATATAATVSPLTLPAAPQTIRMAAFALDFIFVAVPLAAAWVAGFGNDSASIFMENPSSPIGLFLAIFAGYFLLSESFGGQSLAKMIFGLRVVEDDKYEKPTGLRHAVARILLFCAGFGLAGIGLLFSFKDAKKRPWHDIYSGSIVRRKD